MAKLNNFISSVEVPSGISPINEKDFALIDAHYIQTDEDGERLDTRLNKLNITVSGETLVIGN